MNPLAFFAGRLRAFPASVTAVIVLLLLLAGVAVIATSEASYHSQKRQETHVQADILAASVVAALDFDDENAARESVDALRVNPQVRMVAIYSRDGTLVAGHARDSGSPIPPSLAKLPPAGNDATTAIVPVTRSGERIGTVYLVTDPQPFSARIARYVLIALLVLMAAMVIAVLGIAQSALGSANRKLAERADALSAANRELTHQIAERTKAEDQLRQAQKMQALGQLTGGIAHDFNNLLTVIQGSSEMLGRAKLGEERRRRYAAAIQIAAERAASLTGQLLAFARRQPLQPEAIDVNALIDDMREMLDRTLGERFRIVVNLDPDQCPIEADRAQLTSAVLNIALNARDAMPDGGALTIATRHLEEAAGPMIEISVADTGTGMDAETLARAMEPFFTTKAAGRGTGLGLSQVYGFANQSGGELRIESVPGEGTRVAILLPCSETAIDEPCAHDEAAHGSRTGRILLVEDNEDVGQFAEAMLRELGNDVTRVRSGVEALARIADDRFDLVFTDVVMPAMSGIELSAALADVAPGVPVVLTTGFSDEIARSGTGGRPVLLKPYRIDALAAVLDEAFAGAE